MIKAWTRAHTLIAGAALIVLTNAVALGGVLLNRSGEPDARITLTERELGFGWGGMGWRENSGLALQLNWRVESSDQTSAGHTLSGHYGQPEWLDKGRMAELGFDMPERDDAQHRRYERQLPRQVLLVIEYDGPSWQRMLARAQKNAGAHAAAAAANPGNEAFAQRAKGTAQHVAVERNGASRLFAVDAGTDALALRARYPDRARYLIVRGMVRPAMRRVEGQPDSPSGYINDLAITQVNVPLDLRAGLDRIRHGPNALGSEHPPRYAVRIATGQRLEPWIEQVNLLPASPAQ